MYSLVLLTISPLGKTYMEKLESQVVGRYTQVTLTSISFLPHLTVTFLSDLHICITKDCLETICY